MTTAGSASDPALGKFQVRARGTGAQVAATLATTSAAAHAHLSGHLSSLTAFLQDQRVDVSRVTVVQQNLVGGDAGPRDFEGRQQQGGSGSRSRGGRVTQVQAGRVGEAGPVGEAGASAAVEATGMEAATGREAKTGRTVGVRAGGGFSYVDVHA